MYEYSRISSAHQESSFNYFFFKTNSVWLSFMSLVKQSPVHSHPRSDRYRFHFMGWALSKIKHWLTSPTKFVLPLPQHNLQAGQHCRSKDLWISWCFLFCQSQHIFPYQSHQKVGVMDQCNSQLFLYMLNEQCG